MNNKRIIIGVTIGIIAAILWSVVFENTRPRNGPKPFRGLFHSSRFVTAAKIVRWTG